jgi:O-antigen/teichoic acid export membrane protein
LALVQKKEVSEEDYNSVFYLSLTVSFLFYGILFALAPWIASFYKEPLLIWVLRLLSLTVIVGAFKSIQNAILIREMKFNLSFKVSIISTLFSGAVGVGMAYHECGVWALVGSSLSAQVASTIVLWMIIAWRPGPVFSFAAVRQLFGFSSKLLVSGLLNTLFDNLYNLIIGKLFNPTILGYYSRGQIIPNMAMSSVQETISGVIFPALSSCQHDTIRVKEIVRRMIKSTCFLVFPMMVGLAVVAKPLVLLMLTDKWLPCVPYLQITCITFAFMPLHVSNLQAITALGRSDIFLLLEVIKKALIILTILISFRFGVMAMVIGQAICGFFCVLVNAWPNRKLINYSVIQQGSDILPSILLSAAMGLIVLPLSKVVENQIYLLLLQVALGVGFYFSGAKMLNFESADYLLKTGLQFLSSKRQQCF